MKQVKAVLFDCVGTLFRVEADHGLQLKLLHEKLVEEGFQTSYRDFIETYRVVYEKYLRVRLEELREVSNTVWVAETLCRMGFKAEEGDLTCLLYTSPSPRDLSTSRMPSSA